MTDSRTAELAANLRVVQQRIEAACEASGRPLATLIVVTKYFPAEDLHRLVDLGVTDVGENRDQEARAKHEQCADLPLTWHFIGQIQTNKAKSVVQYADLVHTVDRAGLVAALNKAATTQERVLDVLVQVNLDPDPREGRGGCPPPVVPELVAQVDAAANVRLRGVMGVAPLGEPPDPAFARLAAVAAEVRATNAEANIISAGMSLDLEAAVSHGATHLRIGTAVMGSRPTVRYRPIKGGKHNEGDAQ